MPLGNEYLFAPDSSKSGVAPSLRVRLRTFQIPPIRDGAVIGRTAPINAGVMKETLRLMSREPFVEIEVQDKTVASILVREAILRKISAEAVRQIVLRNIKPLMTDSEILALTMEIEVALGESF